MKLKRELTVKSDGSPTGTQIIDTATGEELTNVMAVRFEHGKPGEIPFVEMTMFGVELQFTAKDPELIVVVPNIGGGWVDELEIESPARLLIEQSDALAKRLDKDAKSAAMGNYVVVERKTLKNFIEVMSRLTGNDVPDNLLEPEEATEEGKGQ